MSADVGAPFGRTMAGEPYPLPGGHKTDMPASLAHISAEYGFNYIPLSYNGRLVYAHVPDMLKKGCAGSGAIRSYYQLEDEVPLYTFSDNGIPDPLQDASEDFGVKISFGLNSRCLWSLGSQTFTL